MSSTFNRRRTALRWLSVPVLSIVIAAVIMHKLLGGPAEGTIIDQQVAGQTAKTFDDRPVTVNTPQASFSYPAAFTPVVAAAPAAPLLVSRSFNHRQDVHTWHLAISINRLQSANLEADNSYQFRQQDPSRYKITALKQGAVSYTIITDTQVAGFSQVAYLLDGTRSADISLDGYDAAGNTNLQESLTMVISSWQWH